MSVKTSHCEGECRAPMKAGPLEGECRIQPLQRASVEWARVVEVIERPGENAGALKLSMDLVMSQDFGSEVVVPLSAISQPWEEIHCGLEAGKKPKAFRMAAARALYDTQMPVALTRTRGGNPTRSADWLRLRGPSTEKGYPERLRVRVTMRTANVVSHIRKHLLDAAEAQIWEKSIPSGAVMRRDHLVAAIRYARAHEADSPRGPGELPASWWPLLELYSACALEVLATMCSHECVHSCYCPSTESSRGPALLQSILAARAERLERKHHLQRGEQKLLVRTSGGLFVVAKGLSKSGEGLGWATAYAEGAKRQAYLAGGGVGKAEALRELEGLEGFYMVQHPERGPKAPRGGERIGRPRIQGPLRLLESEI